MVGNVWEREQRNGRGRRYFRWGNFHRELPAKSWPPVILKVIYTARQLSGREPVPFCGALFNTSMGFNLLIENRAFAQLSQTVTDLFSVLVS